MKAIEVQKEIMKSKVNAIFSHYCAGNLYYKIELDEGTFQFPIETTEDAGTTFRGRSYKEIKLSTDLGETTFDATIKGSLLGRWIRKAIASDEFIKVKE